MAATTSGLTNSGVTTHYSFTYDDSLGAPLNPGGPEPARTNAVIASNERLLAKKRAEQSNLIDVLARTPVPAIEARVLQLQQEIDALLELQHDALKRATYVGMTPDEAKVIGERREKIAALVDQLAKLKASE